MPVVLLDYGCVLSLPQPSSHQRRLEAIAGLPPDAFWHGYWAARDPYDAGRLSADEYWGAVAATAGATFSAGQRTALTNEDVEGWLHLNDKTVAVAHRLRESGHRLGVLSNAPAPLARRIEAQPWSSLVDAWVFSCDIGVTKPAPEAFTHALDVLAARPDETVFVDDRKQNCAGATAVGLQAVHFTDASTLTPELIMG